MKQTRLKEKNFVSIIIYLHNNGNVIEELLVNLNGFFSERFDTFEFVLVNDASSDDTEKRIDNVRSQINGNINLVNMAWVHGTELAILAGKDAAIGDYVYEIESAVVDWPLSLLDDLYAKCQSGFDVVAATPIGGEKIISRVFYYLFKRISNLKMNLATETVRLVSRRALNAVLMSKEKVRYRKLLYKLTGFPHVNIRYTPVADSSYQHTFRENFVLAMTILTSYSDIGLHISLLLSLIFFCISVVGGLYAVFMYIYLAEVMEGWTTTMLFLSAGFSGLFFLFALSSKYISNILIEVQDKPSYCVAEIKKISRN